MAKTCIGWPSQKFLGDDMMSAYMTHVNEKKLPLALSDG